MITSMHRYYRLIFAIERKNKKLYCLSAAMFQKEKEKEKEQKEKEKEKEKEKKEVKHMEEKHENNNSSNGNHDSSNEEHLIMKEKDQQNSNSSSSERESENENTSGVLQFDENPNQGPAFDDVLRLVPLLPFASFLFALTFSLSCWSSFFLLLFSLHSSSPERRSGTVTFIALALFVFPSPKPS
jgi:hypothetical protein